MNCKKMFTAVLIIALCAAMTAPAQAATNPLAAMETQSQQAVAVAIKAGTVPPDTTIYDCVYGADKNGATIVIKYRDKNGDWTDAKTQKKKEYPSDKNSTQDEEARIKSMSQWLDGLTLTPSADTPASLTPIKPTDEELAVYAHKVFELANRERRKAGLDEVSWDDDFAACARIRAEELQYRYSHYRPVKPTAGREKWPVLTHGKEGLYNCPSVADEQGVDYTWIWENIVAQRTTPESAVKAWMDSKGHRDNILKESHTRCGVGVFYTGEKSPESHNWYWVIWFDE